MSEFCKQLYHLHVFSQLSQCVGGAYLEINLYSSFALNNYQNSANFGEQKYYYIIPLRTLQLPVSSLI